MTGDKQSSTVLRLLFQATVSNPTQQPLLAAQMLPDVTRELQSVPQAASLCLSWGTYETVCYPKLKVLKCPENPNTPFSLCWLKILHLPNAHSSHSWQLILIPNINSIIHKKASYWMLLWKWYWDYGNPPNSECQRNSYVHERVLLGARGLDGKSQEELGSTCRKNELSWRTSVLCLWVYFWIKWV